MANSLNMAMVNEQKWSMRYDARDGQGCSANDLALHAPGTYSTGTSLFPVGIRCGKAKDQR